MGGVDQPGEVGLGLVNVDRAHGGLQTGRVFSPVIGPWLVRRAAATEGALKQVLKGGIDPGQPTSTAPRPRSWSICRAMVRAALAAAVSGAGGDIDPLGQLGGCWRT